jgi:D-beta-D-heptose 7-phosphate kinase/D-beta-D-heptose 1-phosphate adenosyltransferase
MPSLLVLFYVLCRSKYLWLSYRLCYRNTLETRLNSSAMNHSSDPSLFSLEAKSLTALVKQFTRAKVLCLGDLMLDTFNHGSVERISPERPVPVFRPGGVVHTPGGAANVARNVTSLGAQCTLVGLVGNDEASRTLRSLLQQYPDLRLHLFSPAGYPTTHKVRFTAAGQHLMRLDTESLPEIDQVLYSSIVSLVDDLLTGHDVLILSDYAKGLLSSSLVADLIALARVQNVSVIVDPKGRDFSRYAGATLLTPNTSEAELSAGINIHSDRDAEIAGQKLLASGISDSVLITRGPKGMSLISSSDAPLHLASEALDVYDVVGAGDTVVATLACAIASGASISQAAACANTSAGLVVGKRDTATVAPNELLNRIQFLAEDLHGEGESLVLSRTELVHYVAARRIEGKRIGFTNGVFDIVHPGHVSLLRFARAACDVLLVGVNSDASVHRLGKGPGRPVNSEVDRAVVLGAFGMVDGTILFDEDTPLDLISIIRPDVLIKGADYTLESVVGSELVLGYGGQVLLAPIEAGKSTSRIIQQATNCVS